jgi:hypothetical protein
VSQPPALGYQAGCLLSPDKQDLVIVSRTLLGNGHLCHVEIVIPGAQAQAFVGEVQRAQQGLARIEVVKKL